MKIQQGEVGMTEDEGLRGWMKKWEEMKERMKRERQDWECYG